MCERCEERPLQVGKSIVLVRSIETGADDIYFIENGEALDTLGEELHTLGEYQVVEGLELEPAY